MSPANGSSCPPGSRVPLLPAVHSRLVRTPRLEQHCYESHESGPDEAEPVLLVHGNASSARFFEELMAALPLCHILAPDLRGYGASAAKIADATRGLRASSDDLEALVETLGWERFHLLG
jgi:pimeloyl-ACP methyl ester carboxylesterase